MNKERLRKDVYEMVWAKLTQTTVVIVHKKVYNSPFPIRKLLWNPMRQLQLFSVCCDIYKDCVQ